MIFRTVNFIEQVYAMGGKPDIIRTLVLVFAVGLVVTGLTSLQASEQESKTINAQPVVQNPAPVSGASPTG
ncbi:hypothetical protein [Marinobacter piscensis]|uniref:hypothetical protein n=1 Tax=Marinobacter piscensis TaxID=1562308 RepID=UPI00119DAE2D|nr:hypothetical protein [Marinobacter piscensis]